MYVQGNNYSFKTLSYVARGQEGRCSECLRGGVPDRLLITVDVGDGLCLLELEASLALVAVRHGPEGCAR